jgi:hypothetical protein
MAHHYCPSSSASIMPIASSPANPLTLFIFGTGIVDDMNALIFRESTKKICKTLQAIHKRCLDWARKHGASFAPNQYILVHFTKAGTKHNSPCPLILLTSTFHFHHSVHVMGVIFDKNFSWQPCQHHIKFKLATLTNVLTRLTDST